MLLTGAGVAQAASASRLVPASETGYRLDSAEFKRLYGPGAFQMGALANTVVGVVGSQERIASNRFRALSAGQVSSVRLYWPAQRNENCGAKTGYSCGTGGQIQIQVLPDDNSSQHLPDMNAQPLATGSFTPQLVNGAKPGDTEGKDADGKPLIPQITLTHTGAPLAAGQLYHVVARNVDPAPAQNYISANHVVTRADTGKPARWLDTSDWGALMGYRSSGGAEAFRWNDLSANASGEKYFSPIMEVSMAGGERQGVFDMESGSVDVEDPKKDRIYSVDSSKPVRERFTPGEGKRVSGVSFAAASSTGGSIAWRIKQGDQVLASGRVTQQAPNYDAKPLRAGTPLGNFTWYDAELPQDVVLQAGQSYDLEFQPEGSSWWHFAAHKNGSAYGVSSPAAFTESQAQHLHGGQWINANLYNHAVQGEGTNWPVVLHLAP